MTAIAGHDHWTAGVTEYSWIFGRSVDRLVTVEMRSTGMPYGKIDRMAEAALAESGVVSQTMLAASLLATQVSAGDAVFVVTGAGIAPWLPEGENDGPVGAVVAARSLLLGLGATPVYLTEQSHLRPVVEASAAAGVPVRGAEVPHPHARGALAETSPVNGEEVPEWAREMFDRYRPSAIIFIERLGPNRKGVIHGSTGIPNLAPVDLSPLLTEAQRRGVASIGVGDAGNEIGCGRIFSDIRQIQEFGADCGCPCGDGMATPLATDVLIVAAVSNWGAYGIDACLAHLLGRPDLSQSPELARRIIDGCFAGGAQEAISCSKADLVDGIASASSISLVQILHEMVRISLRPADPGPAH